MQFIFPKNYNFKVKLLGFLDYSTAIANVVWCSCVFFVLNLFPFSITLKIIIFVFLCFPLFLLSLIGFNHENILYVLFYITKFIIRRKVYFYLSTFL